MHSDVLVTVICITFNHKNYIRRCLDSLVSQKTDFRYEVIVHDDASTDGTGEIVREYAERYPGLIIPVIEEENCFSRGIDFIQLKMLPIASGKYCVEVEGDDFWCDPDRLKLQVEALETHPECVVCVHDTNVVDKDGNPQSMHFPDIPIDHNIISTEEFMELHLAQGHWLFHLSSFMVSLDLFKEFTEFKQTGFPSKFYKVGDLPLYLYFSLKGAFYYIDRPMSCYTMESGGFMTRVIEDPVFARRVHIGYINGLKAFDEYSDYRFHDAVTAALVERRFEVDRIERRFDRIVQHPEYRPLVRNRGIFKMIAFHLLGYMMLIFGRKKGKRQKPCRK